MTNEGYNTKILQKEFNGTSLEHELKITDAVLDLMGDPEFYAVFYGNFGYVIPDAVVTYRKPDSYKIVFIEVEEPKPDWFDYMEKKKVFYMQLGKDKDVYEKWWKVWSTKLGLPYPQKNKFCFWILMFIRTDGVYQEYGLFEGNNDTLS